MSSQGSFRTFGSYTSVFKPKIGNRIVDRLSYSANEIPKGSKYISLWLLNAGGSTDRRNYFVFIHLAPGMLNQNELAEKHLCSAWVFNHKMRWAGEGGFAGEGMGVDVILAPYRVDVVDKSSNPNDR